MARCDLLSLKTDNNIMASTHIVKTKGSIPYRFVPRKKSRPNGHNIGNYRFCNYVNIHGEGTHKIDDFMMFTEPDEEDEEDLDNQDAEEDEDGGYIALGGVPQHSSHQSYPERRIASFKQKNMPVSFNFVDYVLKRAQGLNRHEYQVINDEFGTRHMLTTGMFKERPIPLNRVNKVFCSQWLSDHQIVMGTKCNKLMVYDINNQKMDTIPSLISSETGRPPDQQQSGIHAIQINPSKTMLATSAQNSKDIAVYKLPTMDPVCVGEKAHSEWIFDLCWLDDEFLVSCSTDGKLALWRVDETEKEVTPDYPSYSFMKSVMTKKCFAADKLRAVIFNENLSEIVSLSMNAYIHVWDSNRFYQKMSKKLPHGIDNVCLTLRKDCSLYAIGSKSHFTLLDPRTLHHVKKVNTRISGCSVRSISFHGDILTIGTGVGVIMFYDMRAGKYMESAVNNRAVLLKSTKGWVNADENYHDVIHNIEYTPAIYTHCYDWSGTRLFTAGGPLATPLKGNYAALWC